MIDKSSQFLRSKQAVFLLASLLTAAVFLVFSNCLFNGFVWDDYYMIVNDPTLTSLSNLFKDMAKPIGFYGRNASIPIGDAWRPVETATFFLDAALWGKHAAGFHLTNVLLHAAVAVLFFFFLKRILGAVYPAFWIALIYSVHPIHSEAVAYIPSRGELLCGLFVLAALLARERHLNLSAGFFALALYSKETGVAAIGALWLYDHFVLEQKSCDWISAARRYGLPSFILIIYFMTRFYFIGGLGSFFKGVPFPWSFRFWIQPLIFFDDFGMIFWPFGLHTWRELHVPVNFFQAHYLASAASLMLFGLGAAAALRRSKTAAFGVLWFLIFLIPVLNLFVIVNRADLEHWLYLPFMGFLIFLFALPGGRFTGYFNGPKPGHACVLVLAAVLSFLTIRQNATWKDEMTLYEYTSRYVKDDPQIFSNLGAAYAEAGRYEEAERSFEAALMIDPRYPMALANREALVRLKASRK